MALKCRSVNEKCVEPNDAKLICEFLLTYYLFLTSFITLIKKRGSIKGTIADHISVIQSRLSRKFH